MLPWAVAETLNSDWILGVGVGVGAGGGCRSSKIQVSKYR